MYLPNPTDRKFHSVEENPPPDAVGIRELLFSILGHFVEDRNVVANICAFVKARHDFYKGTSIVTKGGERAARQSIAAYVTEYTDVWDTEGSDYAGGRVDEDFHDEEADSETVEMLDVTTPIGVDPILFQKESKILQGHEVEITDDEMPYLWAATTLGAGTIPSCVTSKGQKVPTTELYGAPIHSTFPDTIFVVKTTKPKKNQAVERILRCLPSEIKNCGKLLFRGIKSSGYLPANFVDGLSPLVLSLENQFGRGVYTTFDLQTALDYAAMNGALLIFDWSDHGKGLDVGSLDGEMWKKTVKGHVCINKGKPRPPQHAKDVLIGAIANNHASILNCSDPKADAVVQVVAKNDNGYAGLARRLKAIIYLQ